MSRALYNATVIPEIVRMISEKYSLTEDEAMGRFYKSKTAQALADPETGLYGQSALFLFSQFMDEQMIKQEKKT